MQVLPVSYYLKKHKVKRLDFRLSKGDKWIRCNDLIKEFYSDHKIFTKHYTVNKLKISYRRLYRAIDVNVYWHMKKQVLNKSLIESGVVSLLKMLDAGPLTYDEIVSGIGIPKEDLENVVRLAVSKKYVREEGNLFCNQV